MKNEKIVALFSPDLVVVSVKINNIVMMVNQELIV